MDHNMEDMPIGFTLSMVSDIKAMNAFSSMNEEQRKSVLEEARNVKTKEEMNQLIEKLGTFPL